MKVKLFLWVLAFFLTGISASCEAQSVYITKTGERYHRGDCQYLRYSKFEVTLEEALERGYTPCKVCRPVTTVAQDDDTQTEEVKTPPKPVQGTTTATQCTARTQAGSRCKRTTTNANGRCWQHQ